jgi:O-antigen/teichoic acid export membrane protein
VLIGSLGGELAGVWFICLGVIAAVSLSDFGFSFTISRQVAYTFNLKSASHSAGVDFINLGSGWSGVNLVYSAGRIIFNRAAALIFIILIAAFEVISPNSWVMAGIDGVGQTRCFWYLLALSCLCIFYTKLDQAVLDGLGLMHWSRFVGGTYQLVLAILSITVLSLGFGIIALAVTLVVCSAGQQMASRAILMIKTEGNLKVDVAKCKAYILDFCRISIPFGFINTGVYLVGAIQIPLLGSILGAKVVTAIYTAIKISQVLNGLVSQIASSNMPLFTRKLAEGKWGEARGLMRRILWQGVALHLVSALFLQFLSPPLVSYWIGSGNYISGGVLIVYTANHLITCLAGMPAQFVLAGGRNPFLFSTAMHGAINVVGIIFLCPVFGLIGAPIAGLIGVAMTNLWLNPREGRRTWINLKQLEAANNRAY